MLSKEAKFKKLGESRVRKTLKMIKLVANLANKGRYDYSKKDSEKIIRALTNELNLQQKQPPVISSTGKPAELVRVVSTKP